MNILFIARHVAADVREVLQKAATGQFQAAWCAWVTHAGNAWLVARNRYAAPRVECPCCGWRGFGFRSLDAACVVLHGVECPRCIMHERHRFLQIYLDRHPLPFERPCRLLHVAPERHLYNRFTAEEGVRVVAVDLLPDKLRPLSSPKFRMDLQCLALADGAVDAIVCLHVLEHVPDDRRAIQELYRVLRSGGCALVMVPVSLHLPATMENDPNGPLLYGHLRDYSPQDVPERLAPFEVKIISREDFMSSEEYARFGIPQHELLYLCRKR